MSTRPLLMATNGSRPIVNLHGCDDSQSMRATLRQRSAQHQFLTHALWPSSSCHSSCVYSVEFSLRMIARPRWQTLGLITWNISTGCLNRLLANNLTSTSLSALSQRLMKLTDPRRLYCFILFARALSPFNVRMRLIAAFHLK